MKIERHSFVAVCDGRKFLLLQNHGDEVFLNLQLVIAREMKSPPSRNQGSDAPGRTHQAVGRARSAMEGLDLHDETERRFLQDVAATLHEKVGTGEIEKLIVVAPPRALGMLRPNLSADVGKSIQREIANDFVKLPIGKLEQRLAEMA